MGNRLQISLLLIQGVANIMVRPGNKRAIVNSSRDLKQLFVCLQRGIVISLKAQRARLLDQCFGDLLSVASSFIELDSLFDVRQSPICIVSVAYSKASEREPRARFIASSLVFLCELE